MQEQTTNIRISLSTKEKIDKNKIIDDESYNNAISRLIDEIEQFRKKLGKNRRLDV